MKNETIDPLLDMNEVKEVAPAADKQSRDNVIPNNHDLNNNESSVPEEPTAVNAAPKGISLISAADLFSKPITSNNWLIDKVLPLQSHGFLFGEPGCGKSFVALDMAFCISQGIDWHEQEVDEGAVIYIAGEGLSQIHKRVKALCQEYKVPNPKNLYVSKGGIDLMSKSEMGDHYKTLASIDDIKLIIIDTLNRNCTGDESSAHDMSTMIKHCDILIKELGVTVLVVHHSGHGRDGRMRGSSSIKGAVDTELKMVKSGTGLTLSNTKMKDDEEFPGMNFELRTVEVGSIDGVPITSAVVDRLKEGALLDKSTQVTYSIDVLQRLEDSFNSLGSAVAANDQFYDGDKNPITTTSDKKISKKDWFNAEKLHLTAKPDSKNPDDAKRKKFDRLLTRMLGDHLIAANDGGDYIIVGSRVDKST